MRGEGAEYSLYNFHMTVIGIAPHNYTSALVLKIQSPDESTPFHTGITCIVKVVGIGIVHGPAVIAAQAYSQALQTVVVDSAT